MGENVRRVGILFAALLLATTVSLASPAPAKADAYSCNNASWTPTRWDIVVGPTEVPTFLIGQFASCTELGVMELHIRPEARVSTFPFDVWAAAGPVYSETCPDLCAEHASGMFYGCRDLHYRGEARVEGANRRVQVDAAEALSQGVDLDCSIEMVCPPTGCAAKG